MTFENFNGDTVTETHYFHLSKAELVEMELSMEGGLSKHLERIVENGDGKTIMETFRKLLLDSYGHKTDDGKNFRKTQVIRDNFASSEAYSQIFMELATNAEAAAEFINGIVPAGLEEDMQRFQQNQDKPDLSKPPVALPGQGQKQPHPQPDGLEQEEAPQPLGVAAAGQRIITMAEAQSMDGNELQRLLSSGEARLASTEG